MVANNRLLFGYYKNCILFATFLGFGCGAATRRRVDGILPYFALCIAAMVGGAVLTEHLTQIIPLATGEFIWPQVKSTSAGVVVPLLAPLLLVFAVSALLMLPLGRLVGKHLEAFPPITAYSINIVASLLGVLSFLALSYLSFGPIVWFLIATIPILYFVRANRVHIVWTLTGLLLTIGILQLARAPREYWSPYSKISLADPVPLVNARLLSTNNNGHQVLFDLSPTRLASRGDSRNPVWDLALGMNILGAMSGGMLEYSSLIVGTRAVYLLAFVVFLAIVPPYYKAMRSEYLLSNVAK